MSVPEITHAQLTAKLVAEGCLAIVEGKLPSMMPVQALPLNTDEKVQAGANPSALVVFYALQETGVFLQMEGPHARVWYVGIDTDGALEILEKAILHAHPSAKFVMQTTHYASPGMNVRLYRLDIDSKLFADIEASYPIDRRVRQQFVVRVHARQRI